MDLRVLRLWDIYNPLLTERRREITDLYFNCDLSLAEIAEEKGCSRQSVSDTLGKCRRQLEEYEEKLHVARLLQESSLAQSLQAADIARWAQTLPDTKRREIEAILQRDYAAKAREAIENEGGAAAPPSATTIKEG